MYRYYTYIVQYILFADQNSVQGPSSWDWNGDPRAGGPVWPVLYTF